MIELTTLSQIVLTEGTIALSDEQARRRLRYGRVGEVRADSPIAPVKRKKGVYTIQAPCQLKAGEDFALAEPPPKGLWGALAARGETVSILEAMMTAEEEGTAPAGAGDDADEGGDPAA